MSIPHFKNSDPAFAKLVFDYDFAPVFYVKLQCQYLIHLIKKKTSNPEKGIVDLIESNDLTNIELAYLLTYQNKES